MITNFSQENFEQLLSQLCPLECLPCHYWEVTDSTNQQLGVMLDQGLTLPRIAIASQQTAGRGQWGRQWLSAVGGLYLSMGLAVDIAAQDAPHLTLASAWGIASQLRDYGVGVWLKWPNDLVVQGRKLGGIKTETKVQGKRIKQAIVGVGINWCNDVPETGINLVDFGESRINSLEMLGAIATYGILQGYRYYQEAGIEQLLKNYLEIFANLGQSITFEGNSGIIVGVTTQGELKIRLQSTGASTEVCLEPGAIALGYNLAMDNGQWTMDN